MLDNEEEAKAVVMKWAFFIQNEKPYDLTATPKSAQDLEPWMGVLKPEWRYFFRVRSRVLDFDNETFCHKSRREQWGRLLAPPSRLERVTFYYDYWNAERLRMQTWRHMERTWSHVSTYPWETTALIYAMIMVAVCQNTPSFVALAGILYCRTVNTHAS